MKVWIFWVFLSFLFLATCTESLSLLILQQKVTFNFTINPPVWDFFRNDLTLEDPTYVIQKIGHIFSFFIFGVLIYWVWRSIQVVLSISFTVALSTEVAQLFFSRSGRLLDVIYDLSGIFLFLLFFECFHVIKILLRSNQTVNRR
ncbi:VanZ family protein [Metabacillus crassostreae]|uniref:VanZ family protein n=1 Tax=Metabacillus crassostreae TaxID=929098 RepID=UPI00195A3051|nr:VanZ family protein [Metabacillus crassostreae]MBM7606278.1 VanZ family protein [Metabacillus crassostreae]